MDQQMDFDCAAILSDNGSTDITSALAYAAYKCATTVLAAVAFWVICYGRERRFDASIHTAALKMQAPSFDEKIKITKAYFTLLIFGFKPKSYFPAPGELPGSTMRLIRLLFLDRFF